MKTKRKREDFCLESLPGDTVEVDKDFWNPFNGWPFDELYEAVGRGLKHGKNKKGKRNIRLRGRSKR